MNGFQGATIDKRSGYLNRFALLICTFLLLSAYNSASAQEPYDHFSTGFQLDGAHANVACDRCHVGRQIPARHRQVPL